MTPSFYIYHPTMIDTRIKIHDKFSVEFKIGFFTSQKENKTNEFKINTWIFVPNGLDINRHTYSKEQFYSDIKSNVRLITPIYSLKSILTVGKGPFKRLNKAIEALLNNPDEANSENYTYQVKMLLCIIKSALRESNDQILSERDKKQNVLPLIEELEKDITQITALYRNIRDRLLKETIISDELKEYSLFGDEYLSDLVENNVYCLLDSLKNSSEYSSIQDKLLGVLKSEAKNRELMRYSGPKEDKPEHNSLILIKRSLLKKFIESDLFLQRIKKADGLLMREVYYSIAAGVAMIFATVISFIATQRFGNFTSTLFVVLVISYMFKDRIKEMIRIYFSSKLDKKYFDWKWDVSLRGRKIGQIREAFDFISQEKVPEKIINLRKKTPLVKAENKVYDEKVILYRKRLVLSKDDLEQYKEYHLSGINDIIRFNLTSFTKKMDNSTTPIHLLDEEAGFKTIIGNRVYALYFIIECQSENETYYKSYRLLFNRNGISDVREID